MARLFLGANVLFSAAYRVDASIRKLWKLPGIELVTSLYAVEEARRNLDTSRRESDLENLLEDMRTTAGMIPDDPPPLLEPGLPDKDLPILRAAVSSGATHLLTGDFKHFGPFYRQKIGGVLILTPAEYLRFCYEHHQGN